MGKSSEFFQVPEPIWKRQLEQCFAKKLYFKEGERPEFSQVSGHIWKGQLEQRHLAPHFAQCFASRLDLKEEGLEVS